MFVVKNGIYDLYKAAISPMVILPYIFHISIVDSSSYTVRYTRRNPFTKPFVASSFFSSHVSVPFIVFDGHEMCFIQFIVMNLTFRYAGEICGDREVGW